MSVQDPVRIAVVGVGHLGRHHARILAGLPEAELVGVVDSDAQKAGETGEQWGVPFATSLDAVWKDFGAEAVSVVVPTALHHEVATAFLERDIDVLVEKPITRSPEEAEELCHLARDHGRILQVGHVERFNPAVKAALDLGIQPRYLECDRLAPFTFRSTDIGVVLDLMIHDLDLLLTLVGSPVADVEAFGGAIFTPAEDLASARILFENGSVARLTANRVALKPARKMRLFSADSYVSLDFGQRYGLIIQKGEGWDLQKLRLEELDLENVQNLWNFVFEGLLKVQELKMGEEDPLSEELRAFAASVRDRSRPMVDGEAGLRALRVASQVLASIAKHPW